MKYLQQFVTTSLNVGGGIDASQTTGIVLQSLNNVDATKPSVACVTWADPLSTSVAEWVTYTSINSTTNELQGVTRGAEGYSAKTHSNGAVVAFPLSKAHVNELNDEVSVGWTPVYDTWAYASATTITVPSGAASLYQKGDKLRFKQGAGYKYYYIVGVADTVLTVTGGSDYTVANSAITDIAISRAENPFGFPTQFTWTPVYSGFGSLTFGTVTTQLAKFSVRGDTCTVSLRASGTTGGVTNNGITVTTPLASATDALYFPTTTVKDTAGSTNLPGAGRFRSSGVVDIFKVDASNYGLGASTVVTVQGFYTY
jgi:hypothetical protein